MKNFNYVVYTKKNAYYFYKWKIAFWFLCSCLDEPGNLCDIDTFNEERNIIIESY